MLTLFEVLLTKNAVDHLKFVSRKRVVISLNGCPFHKCGTRAYQCTKYERIRILGCVRDFFGFYRHLLLNPDTRRYTWRRKRPEVQCRLDLFLIT